MPSLGTEERHDDDSGASVARAARAGRARRHRRRRPAHSRRARRLRHRAHVAAACALRDLLGRSACQYIDVERIATTPERFLQAIRDVVAVRRFSPGRPRVRTDATAREAFDAALAFLDTARAPGDAPATFLLDEFLELRTFESFPGLRTVLRDLVARARRERQPLRADHAATRPARTALLRDAPRAVRDHPRRAARAPPRSARRCPPAPTSTARPPASPRPRTTARATSWRGWSRRCRTAGRRTRA